MKENDEKDSGEKNRGERENKLNSLAYEKSIVPLRNEIDEIDRALEQLLLNRFAITDEIAKMKEDSGVQTYDPNREAAMREKRKERLSQQPHQNEVLEIFETIVACSRKSQERFRK